MPEGWTESLLKDKIADNRRAQQGQTEEKKKAEEDQTAQEKIKSILEKLKSEEEQRKKRQSDCHEKAEIMKQKGEGLQRQIEDLKNGLPDQTETEEKAWAVIQQKEKDKAQLEKAIRDAEKEYQDAHEALIRIQENINTLSGELCDAPESDMEQLEREKRCRTACACGCGGTKERPLCPPAKQQEAAGGAATKGGRSGLHRARIPHDE